MCRQNGSKYCQNDQSIGLLALGSKQLHEGERCVGETNRGATCESDRELWASSVMKRGALEVTSSPLPGTTV